MNEHDNEFYPTQPDTINNSDTTQPNTINNSDTVQPAAEAYQPVEPPVAFDAPQTEAAAPVGEPIATPADAPAQASYFDAPQPDPQPVSADAYFGQTQPVDAAPVQAAPATPYSDSAYQYPPAGYPQPTPIVTQRYNTYAGQGYSVPVAPPAPIPPKKKSGGKALRNVVCVMLAIVILLVGVGVGKVTFSDTPGIIGTSGEKTTASSGSNGETTTENGGAPSLKINEALSTASAPGTLSSSDIAEKVAPSVVAVLVYSNSTGNLAGEGSGIIMGEDTAHQYTYVVTCAHIISDAGISISVQLEDGTQYEATSVGYDNKTDVGVIKIKTSGLIAAEFGDSDALRVGDVVYAMGNPGGTEFFGSFTGGMVSAIDRSVTSTYTMVCIQHDAAINPGNSGGALINSLGQVIGINSLKIVNTEYEGMGFAIPINSAQSVVNDLISYGYVPNRPKLGIQYASVNQYQQYSMLVQVHNLPGGSLIIMKIDDDSSLIGSEAQMYDLIISVDGKDMTSSDVLLDKIENGKVGDKLTLKIGRINNNYQLSTFDIEITLVEDKGTTGDEEETTTSIFDSYFNNPFGY